MLRGTCKSKCHNFVNTYCMELDPQSTILRRMHKPTRRARTQHNLLVSDPPPSESCVSAAETLLVCPKQVKVIVKLLRCYEIMKGLTTGGCLTDYHKGAHPCGKCHMYSVPKCFSANSTLCLSGVLTSDSALDCILLGKNQLSSPRAGPLGGTNDNHDTLGVGTRSRIGYRSLVHVVQSQREKIRLLDLILGGFRIDGFLK